MSNKTLHCVFPWFVGTVVGQPIEVVRAARRERGHRLIDIMAKFRGANWLSWASIAGVVFRVPADGDFTGCELDDKGSPLKAKLRQMGIDLPYRRIRDSKEKYPLSFSSVLWHLAGFSVDDEHLRNPNQSATPLARAPAATVDRMKLVQQYRSCRLPWNAVQSHVIAQVMLSLKSPDRRERERSIRYLQEGALVQIVQAVGDELAWQACSLDPEVSRKAHALIRLIGPDRLDSCDADEDQDDEDLDDDPRPRALTTRTRPRRVPSRTRDDLSAVS
jgi:hypothetical protein